MHAKKCLATQSNELLGLHRTPESTHSSKEPGHRRNLSSESAVSQASTALDVSALSCGMLTEEEEEAPDMGSEHHPVMMLGLAETSNNLLLGNLPSIRPEPRCADGSPARELLAALEAFSMVEPSQDIVVADPESEQSELEWLRRELKSARLHIAELQAELLAKPTRSHSTRPFRPFESTKPSQSARPSRCTTPSYSTALSHSARPSQCPARCARGRVRTLCRAQSRALRCGAHVTRPVCTSPHAHPHMHLRREQYVCRAGL